MIYKHDFPPVVAEALAVHRGLLFVRDAGLLPCVVETDAQVVVKLIEFSNAPLSDTNIATHKLARLGLSIDSALFWMDEAPCVAPVVLDDYPIQFTCTYTRRRLFKSQSTTPLSFNTDSSSNRPQKPTSTIIFIALVLVTCIALSAAAAFAFLFFSSSSNSSSSFSSSLKSTAHPLKKLNKSVVLLISSDGFWFGYQFKTPIPNIHRLIQNGTEAETCVLAAAMADQIDR
ncbi:hypothetical protein Q3G72_021185 [Acer saccharum]|nr:hypothetical protein Q3G72_021185 [Acer saccharum]